MILDSCYNRSDHQLEFQIQDRISFQSVWLFNPQRPGRTGQKTFSVVGPFSAPKGPMVAASMLEVPKQPNSREENKSIKNGFSHFGDQNQIEIDVKHKLIGRDEVRPAWVYDRDV